MQSPSLVLTAYQGLLAQSLDVVANNVANVSTSGFKREDVDFSSLVVRPAPDTELVFATDRGTFRDTAQGPIHSTGNPLDLAIQGGGYFQIRTAEGTRYTRGGAFQLNAAGEIVNAVGQPLLADGDQPLVVPPDVEDLSISGDGVVSGRTGGNAQISQFGKVKLVKFAHEQSMQMVGSNLYTSDETPVADADSRLVQGAVEQSNVQAVSEMTKMIEILRSYQMTMRMLDLEHQRLSGAISRLGKVSA